MSESNWIKHLMGLANLEKNIGKKVAFESSADMIKELENDLTTARQEATAYRISLDNLEAENEKLKEAWEEAAALGTDHEFKHRKLLASLPKIKADAVCSFVSRYAPLIDANFTEKDKINYHCEYTLFNERRRLNNVAKANKLEAGE